MSTEKILEEIREDIGVIQGDVREVKTLLLGVPSTRAEGLVGQVEEHSKDLKRLNLRFWILTAILLGTGGGSAYGILKLL